MAEKLRPDSLAFIALLAFLAAFGPLSVDLYLPSLPSVGPALGATEAQVQLTISLYLVGYAIGQAVYGPLSDPLVALLATRYLAESRAPTIAPLRVILANYRIVLSHPAFLANLVIGALAYAGLFAWIVGSPFVLQGLLKLTPVEFSLFYALANV